MEHCFRKRRLPVHVRCRQIGRDIDTRQVLRNCNRRSDVNFYATTSSFASAVEAMLAGFVDVGCLGPKFCLVAPEKLNGATEPFVTCALPDDMFMDEH